MNELRLRSDLLNEYLGGAKGYVRLCPLCKPEVPFCGGQPVLHTEYCLNFADAEVNGVPQVWFPVHELPRDDYVVPPMCMYMEDGECVEYFEYYWFLDTSYQPLQKIEQKPYCSDDDDDEDHQPVSESCDCSVLY